MLGPKLASLVTDDYSRRAGAAYARSLVSGVELSEDDDTLSRELEAAIEAMYLMATADGKLGDDEMLLLSSSLQHILESCCEPSLSATELSLPMFKLSDTMGRFARALESEDIDTRIASVGRRLKTEAARRMAFRLAAGVAFVDELVEGDEVAALDTLGAALGFSSREQLDMLREVLTILRE